jgi:hypothetical protein
MLEACPIILNEKKRRCNHNLPTKKTFIDVNIGSLGETEKASQSADSHTTTSKAFEEAGMFRDMITGDNFADPAFCDKGHSREVVY